ncbi:hypothetical protein ABD91_21150 [Lysinibacillus sphaericus]|uniref:hypothetical protein n=1 Tax=Lysinibacillus sphaericus TaxID=1421 RepID=UPI0018CD2E3E|nr:hypothetical protein [Lysinibacillus sphaericus]MBG9693248.1 hypothetical protein [Lysinibacillus sphaericus]
MNTFVVKASDSLNELELMKYGKVIGYPMIDQIYRYLLIAESPQVLDSLLMLPGVISINEEHTNKAIPYQIGDLLYAITTVLGIVEGTAYTNPAMDKTKDVIMRFLQQGYLENTEENNLYFNRGLYVCNHTSDDRVS